jgi:hypothetical protein
MQTFSKVQVSSKAEEVVEAEVQAVVRIMQ